RTPMVADPRGLLDHGDDRDRGHRASARSLEFDRITFVAAGRHGAVALCSLGHALDRSLSLLRAEALRLVDSPGGVDTSGRSALGAAPAGVFDLRALAGDAIRRQHSSLPLPARASDPRDFAAQPAGGFAAAGHPALRGRTAERYAESGQPVDALFSGARAPANGRQPVRRLASFAG